MDIFESKNIKPMLLSETHQPFDSTDYIFELKLDGIRCVAYLDQNTVELRNKRNMRLNQTYPELMNINKQVKKRCILDGELLVVKDGKPDFYDLQKRSLMTNKTKIEFAKQSYPVSFCAYDILYLDNQQITDKPLMQRKDFLQEIIIENQNISISRFIPDLGIKLYELTEQQGLEGIVAKKKESKYYFDKRTKDWLKVKNLQDEDFIICGYIEKENNVVSLVLGAYKGDNIISQGHVTLGVSRDDFKTISSIEKGQKLFEENINTIWIMPVLVCTVSYMSKSEDAMRQPVFKSLRNDKSPKECVIKENNL